jgi:hypothetical protein
LATAIEVKVFDQDGDDADPKDTEAMGECQINLELAKAAEGKLTCTLKREGKDAGTLEFLVHDKSRAEDLRNKAEPPPPPKCKAEEGKCLNLVSRSVPV